jgi:hypothetical protein
MHIDIGNETKQIESIVNKSAFNQRRTAVKKKKGNRSHHANMRAYYARKKMKRQNEQLQIDVNRIQIFLAVVSITWIYIEEYKLRRSLSFGIS